MAAESVRDLVVDDFCLRQFSPEYGGSKITMPPAEFEAKVNAYYHANPNLADGYAPFCKHIFMPNFAGLTAGTAPITPENEHLLRSVYEARTEQELPVMVRACISTTRARKTTYALAYFNHPSSILLCHGSSFRLPDEFRLFHPPPAPPSSTRSDSSPKTSSPPDGRRTLTSSSTAGNKSKKKTLTWVTPTRPPRTKPPHGGSFR